jgi:hypothetical protein
MNLSQPPVLSDVLVNALGRLAKPWVDWCNAVYRMFEGPSDWRAPSFQNNWADLGAAWRTCRYTRTGNTVKIEGLIKKTAGVPALLEVIFNLPTGFRPSQNLVFTVIDNGLFGRVDVYSTGNVAWIFGSTGAYLNLNITFQVD